MIYHVHEIFKSIQGEGVLAGTPCTFVRLWGCPIGCPWCDTPQTDITKSRLMTPEEIWAECFSMKTRTVVITGGEPTAQKVEYLIALLRYGKSAWNYQDDGSPYPSEEAIRNESFYVTMETAGLRPLKRAPIPNWITLSPKENLRKWDIDPWFMEKSNEIKFVVDSYLPWEVVERTYKRLIEVQRNRHWSRMAKIVLMPEGAPPKQENIDKTLEWLMKLPRDWQQHFMFGGRLQCWIGVK